MKRRRIKKRSKKQKKKDAIHATIREICLLRHPYCVICGRRDGVMQGGHLIPKARSESVRYDLMNVFTSCPKCNSRHRFDPHIMTAWFVKEYGAEEYEYLVDKSRLTVGYKDWELDEIHNDLKEILSQIRKQHGKL